MDNFISQIKDIKSLIAKGADEVKTSQFSAKINQFMTMVQDIEKDVQEVNSLINKVNDMKNNITKKIGSKQKIVDDLKQSLEKYNK